jgi:ribonuclease HII
MTDEKTNFPFQIQNEDRLLAIEEQLRREEGFLTIAGVDEAGRGPLAGPVYAAVCVIPAGIRFAGVDDSKKLSASAREDLFLQITGHPDVLYAISHVEADAIDQINILQATFQAMRNAVAKLPISPDIALIDGSLVPKPFPCYARALVHGDALSQSIAAASILAKVSRDTRMKLEDLRYPGYGFVKHFGYGTPEHLRAIEKLGPCALHRKSFAPLKKAEDICSQLTFFPLS